LAASAGLRIWQRSGGASDGQPLPELEGGLDAGGGGGADTRQSLQLGAARAGDAD